MTIEREIEQYGKTISNKRYEVRRKIIQRLEQFFQSIHLLHVSIDDVKNNTETFMMKTIDGIHSYTRSKKRLANSLRHFFMHLNERYNLHINIDQYLPLGKYMEMYERRLELLKFLQEEPKTREQIAEYFGISQRTVQDDLDILQSGEFDFLDYNMKIELEYGDNTYDSTIHPIFLPLNLSEVYALTIGLKMLGDNHIFSDMYDYIAESIYSQLSPYGKRIIEKSAKKEQIALKGIDAKEYRYEYDLLDDLLKDKRQGMYTYFIKSGEDCEIEYLEAEESKTIIGKVETARNGRGKRAYDRIVVRTDDGSKRTILIKRIVKMNRIQKRS